jgi:hypothetical protein
MDDSAAQPAVLTPEQTGLLRLVYGAQAAQIIYVAAKLGVPDILKDGPRSRHQPVELMQYFSEKQVTHWAKRHSTADPTDFMVSPPC